MKLEASQSKIKQLLKIEKKLIQFIKFNLFDVFIHFINEMFCNCFSNLILSLIEE